MTSLNILTMNLLVFLHFHVSALLNKITKVEGDCLAYWLNSFIESGLITREHLIYQHIDAFFSEQLSQPNPVANWKHWPTVFSFCELLAELATQKCYMFFLGNKRFGFKDHRIKGTSSNRIILPSWTFLGNS